MTTAAALPHPINTNTNTDPPPCYEHPESPALSDDEAAGYTKYTPRTHLNGSEALQAPRSLEREFERLHLADVNSSYESVPPTLSSDYQKDGSKTKTTPNSVLDLDLERFGSTDEDSFGKDSNSAAESCLPSFEIHLRLQGALTQQCVDRVAAYTLIHSVNCESSTMSAHDSSDFMTANPKELVDEERWLLSVIGRSSATEVRTSPSPTTFLEAIGERNKRMDCTPNPLNVVSNSRTQLWKPSRSWWEAKSGKNPWIEPRLHAKRWRYLWPLIHYHKFLAKCIKKLKRYGVDYSDKGVLPCFLRAEVVAISSHLASVSEFTAEDWTATLSNFHCWSYPTEDPKTQVSVRRFLNSMALRRSQDLQLNPADEQSPLLMQQLQCGPDSIRTHKVTPKKNKGTPRSNQHHQSPRQYFNSNSRGAKYNVSSGSNTKAPRYTPSTNRNHHNHSGAYYPHGHGYVPPPPYYGHGGYDHYNGDAADLNVNCSFNTMDSSYDEYDFSFSQSHSGHGHPAVQWAHLDPMRSIATPPRHAHSHGAVSGGVSHNHSQPPPPMNNVNLNAHPHPHVNSIMSPASQFMMGGVGPGHGHAHPHRIMAYPPNMNSLPHHHHMYPPPPNYDYSGGAAAAATGYTPVIQSNASNHQVPHQQSQEQQEGDGETGTGTAEGNEKN
uniref:Uncharacterized protein n=1 Tax=Leptocylindrus danicus TaxID=163516 RepID=A0A7S2PJN9_9STRA|mmetsp:Transcript_34254/g.49754  ORF Transcript_34254/g.49754 Transcript_34254/m.49754 type:complete len:665 (+) Transcript_34254:174-2168(+)